LSDASPFDLIWFNDERRAKVEEYLHSEKARAYLPALESTAELVDGFESPLGMELLSTVDWPLVNGYQADISSIREGISKWPGENTSARRKQKLFDDRLLQLALDRLEANGRLPHVDQANA
jgi:hypothetical protein